MPRHVSETEIQEALLSDEESCKLCWKFLGFPKMAALQCRERWINGREYVEGCGQMCGECMSARAAEQNRAVSSC